MIVMALLPTLMGSWLDLASSLRTSWWCPGGECEREAVTGDVEEEETVELTAVLAAELTSTATEAPALLEGLVAALVLAPGGVGGLDLLFDIFGVFPVNKSIFKLS